MALDLAALLDEIKVARLQPGDVIVVKTNGASGEDVEYIQQSFEYLFPDNKTIVLDGDISMEIVRPESEQCAYGHIRTWTSAVCQVCGELQEDPPPATLVRFEEGSLDWGDGDPCAHSGDPCEKCGKPFPLRDSDGT